MAGDLSGAWKDVFAELLLCDVVRGPHSTGIGLVTRRDTFDVIKRPGHPFNLFESQEYDDAMGFKHSYKVIIGHNRFATIGEKSEANAHPFAFKNIVGAHNGTLDKWIIKDLHNAADFGTDSEAIFATINQLGIDKTIPLISGAWALTWYDVRDDTLNFLRNDKRPLTYCYSEDRCTLIWASEMEMLKYVMARRNKKIFGENGGDFFTSPPNMLYSWKIPKTINSKFPNPSQRTIEGKKYVWAGLDKSFTTHSPVHHGTNFMAANKTVGGSHSNVIPFAKRKSKGKFRQPYKDSVGKVINKKMFDSMVQEGCVFCNSNDQKWNTFIHVLGQYHGPFTPYMCEDCWNKEETYTIASYAI